MFIPPRPYPRPGWLLTATPGRPEWLSNPRWFPSGERRLYVYARTGLYAAFAATGTDTVLLPTYLPRGIPWAARAAGATVHRYGVEQDLRLDPDHVADRIAETGADAVLFVHYLGFRDPAFRELAEVASGADALVVEDCARAVFCRDDRGKPFGAEADVSIFGFRKTLSSPHGGLVVAPNIPLPTPSRKIGEWWDAIAAGGIAAARRTGRVPPMLRDKTPPTTVPSVPKQTTPPDDCWPDVEPGHVSRVALDHTEPSTVRDQRRRRYREVRASLVDVDGLEVVTPKLSAGESPYGVGVLAQNGSDRATLFRSLLSRGCPVEANSWRPETGAAQRDDGAAALRERLLVVPTHHQVPDRAVPHIAAAVRATRQ